MKNIQGSSAMSGCFYHTTLTHKLQGKNSVQLYFTVYPT